MVVINKYQTEEWTYKFEAWMPGWNVLGGIF